MYEFKIIPINNENIEKAIQVFARAMNFSILVEQSVLTESSK